MIIALAWVIAISFGLIKGTWWPVLGALLVTVTVLAFGKRRRSQGRSSYLSSEGWVLGFELISEILLGLLEIFGAFL